MRYSLFSALIFMSFSMAHASLVSLAVSGPCLMIGGYAAIRAHKSFNDSLNEKDVLTSKEVFNLLTNPKTDIAELKEFAQDKAAKGWKKYGTPLAWVVTTTVFGGYGLKLLIRSIK